MDGQKDIQAVIRFSMQNGGYGWEETIATIEFKKNSPTKSFLISIF